MAAYKVKPCRSCGGEKGAPPVGYKHRLYCRPCTAIAQMKYWARRSYYCGSCASPWVCEQCQANKAQGLRDAARRGAATRRLSQPNYFRPENAEQYWQRRAHTTVGVAVRAGLLPDLKSREYACADCGGVALEYDHRDYSRPLDVDPVCRPCNKRRGTAVWPTSDRYSFEKRAA